jgi:hypothetical protein
MCRQHLPGWSRSRHASRRMDGRLPEGSPPEVRRKAASHTLDMKLISISKREKAETKAP